VIKPGDEWGTPTDGSPDDEVHGTDAALAASLPVDGSAPLVRWSPINSDFARSVGLHPDSVASRSGGGGIELPVDALAIELHGESARAINAIVVGIGPPRLRWRHRRRPVTVRVDGHTTFVGNATTVVIANGQYLNGQDLVPRGHPGDGRVEVQIYALKPGERRPMRQRLPSGTHLPHPRIVTATGRSIEINTGDRAWRVELDGVSGPPTHRLRATVISPAIRLLI